MSLNNVKKYKQLNTKEGVQLMYLIPVKSLRCDSWMRVRLQTDRSELDCDGIRR